MRQVTGWKRYGELADFLGVKSAAISGAKARGSMPIDWGLRVARSRGISTDWLLTGEDCKSAFDIDVLVRVAQFFEKVLEDRGVKLGWKPKGKLFALVFQDTRAQHHPTFDEDEIWKIMQKYLELLETL